MVFFAILQVMPWLEKWLNFSVTPEQASGMTLLEDWLNIWMLIFILRRLSPNNAYYRTIFWLTIMALLVFSLARQTVDAYHGASNGTILTLIAYYCLLLVLATSLLFTNFRFYGGAVLIAILFQLGSQYMARTLTPVQIGNVLWISAIINLAPLVVLIFCFFGPSRGEEQAQDILHE